MDEKVYQMHWQSKDGTTDFVSQIGIDVNLPSSIRQNLFKQWSKTTAIDHPLPDGASWLWCEEGSVHFMGGLKCHGPDPIKG